MGLSPDPDHLNATRICRRWAPPPSSRSTDLATPSLSLTDPAAPSSPIDESGRPKLAIDRSGHPELTTDGSTRLDLGVSSGVVAARAQGREQLACCLRGSGRPTTERERRERWRDWGPAGEREGASGKILVASGGGESVEERKREEGKSRPGCCSEDIFRLCFGIYS